MVYTSKHNYVLFGVESTFGTAVSATKDLGLIQSITPSAKNNTEVIHTTGTRLPAEVIAQNFEGNLDLEFLFQHGRVFELFFGTTPTHATTSADTVHTIVAVGSSLPVAEEAKSITIEDGFNSTTDVVNKYVSHVISSLTVSLDVKGKVTIKTSGSYANMSAVGSSASSAVISTLATFPSFMGTLKRGTEGSESAVGRIQSAEITFENNPTPVNELGSRFMVANPANDFNIRYRFTLAFEDSAQQQIFMGGTAPLAGTPAAKGLVFNATNGTTLGSGRREIDIQLRGCQDEDWSNPVQVGNVVIQEISGTAKTLYSLKTTDNIASGSW